MSGHSVIVRLRRSIYSFPLNIARSGKKQVYVNRYMHLCTSVIARLCSGSFQKYTGHHLGNFYYQSIHRTDFLFFPFVWFAFFLNIHHRCTIIHAWSVLFICDLGYKTRVRFRHLKGFLNQKVNKEHMVYSFLRSDGQCLFT